MKRRRLRSGFYFITDSTLTVNGLLEDVRQALSAGVVVVQYREKGKTPEVRRSEALAIMGLCRKAGVPFIVNDDAVLAKDIGADGVHVGPHDMPPAEARKVIGRGGILGVSAGSVEEALAAVRDGADYVAASPVFATPTKPDAGKPLGLHGLSSICAAVKVPVVAIGGLNEGNVRQAIEAGADLICAISASLKNGTVEENIRRMMRAR